MTPLGHAVSGYLAGRLVGRVSVRATVIGAVILDIDFLLLYRDDFNELHRSFSHSLLCVVALAAVGGLLVRPGQRRPVAGGLALGGMCHLFFDSILDNNPSNGVGVSLLWPIHEESLSPFNLLDASDAGAGAAGWDDVGAMLQGAAWPLVVEVALCAALAAVAWLVVARRARRQ